MLPLQVDIKVGWGRIYPSLISGLTVRTRDAFALLWPRTANQLVQVVPKSYSQWSMGAFWQEQHDSPFMAIASQF
jgi:hypothetical protein